MCRIIRRLAHGNITDKGDKMKVDSKEIENYKSYVRYQVHLVFDFLVATQILRKLKNLNFSLLTKYDGSVTLHTLQCTDDNVQRGMQLIKRMCENFSAVTAHELWSVNPNQRKNSESFLDFHTNKIRSIDSITISKDDIYQKLQEVDAIRNSYDSNHWLKTYKLRQSFAHKFPISSNGRKSQDDIFEKDGSINLDIEMTNLATKTFEALMLIEQNIQGLEMFQTSLVEVENEAEGYIKLYRESTINTLEAEKEKIEKFKSFEDTSLWIDYVP
jgi:hypothetical protein